MTISAAEQYLIELINQGRLDPVGTANAQGIGLNNGITDAMGGPIQTTPMQVLAPNVNLEAAANAQSEFLLDDGTYFGHSGEDGNNALDRILDGGYISPITYRENLSVIWGGLNDLTSVVDRHYDALFASASHRAGTFDDNQSDIGIGIQDGPFRGTDASMLTEVFAAQSDSRYVTGVVYADRDRDNFYSIGEGIASVDISTDQAQASSASAGGYALDGNADGFTDVTISVSGASAFTSTVSIDTSDGNAKLDLILQNNGDYTLAVSADTVLGTGVDDAALLGVGNLDLTGHSGNNLLEGNKGNNTLRGEAGNDVLKSGGGKDKLYGGDGRDKLVAGGGRDKLYGEDGNDTLKGGGGKDTLYGGNDNDKLLGGGGNDVLFGGAGNDVLKGGGGADKFMFSAGQDVIRDFKDDVDRVYVDAAMVNGAGSTVDDLMEMGEIINGNAVFDLEGSHQLTINGVTDLEDLRDDLFIG